MVNKKTLLPENILAMDLNKDRPDSASCQLPKLVVFKVKRSKIKCKGQMEIIESNPCQLN